MITGAASGIGFAAALKFMEAGAAVALAGRDPAALEDALEQCRRGGGTAIAVPTDVRNDEEVFELARRAVAEFGRIDVWVNNAAVTAFGSVEQVPAAIARGVMETNFLGYLHGLRAVLPVFRAGGGGVVVNVNSGVAFACQPGTGAYIATKHALRALSSCTRMDLLLEGCDDIYICDVFPASVDTPLFERGANFSGRAVRPIPPVHDPDQIAEAILSAVLCRRRETFIGVPHRLLVLLQALAPALSERWIARYVARRHFAGRGTKNSDGNVYGPTASRAQMRGGWR